MNTVLKLTSFFIVILLFSCNSEMSEEESLQQSIDSLEKLYANEPSADRASGILDLYKKKVEEFSYKEEDAEDFRRMGDLASDMNNANSIANYYIWTLKADPNYRSRDSLIIQIADAYSNMNSSENNAKLLYTAYLENFPDGNHADYARSVLNDSLLNISAYIDTLSNRIFVGDNALRKQAFRKFIDASELYATVFPDNKDTPTKIQQASVMLKAMDLNDKALSFYDWILIKYPESDEAQKALFYKAFYYDEDAKDSTKAIQYYQEFIDKYPESDLADDAEKLIERIK